MGIKNKIKSAVIGATMLATAASPAFAKDKRSEMDMINELAQQYNIELSQDAVYFDKKLPEKEIDKNHGGGTDRNPSFYKATKYEKILLARAIASESQEFSLEHQVAVGEVIMRRVMSSEWGRGKNQNQNTIYDVLSAKGQYPGTWKKVLNEIKHRNHVTPKELLAAEIALSGTTNFSNGSYYQHSKMTDNIMWIDKKCFSDCKQTKNYKLRDFTTLKRYVDEMENFADLQPEKKEAEIQAVIQDISPEETEQNKRRLDDQTRELLAQTKGLKSGSIASNTKKPIQRYDYEIER